MSGGSAAIPRAGCAMSATSRLGSSGPYAPARDTGVALVMTRLDTAAMNLFLAELGQAVAPGAHGIVLMDKAGWHTAGDLVVPEMRGSRGLRRMACSTSGSASFIDPK